jgi:MFS family permease
MAVALALGSIGSVGMWAVVVVLPTVQLDLGVDRADASLPFAMTMAGFAVGNFVVGRYTDRLGITLPVIVSAFLLCAGFALAAASPTILAFAGAHLVIGIGASATFGPLLADISHWFEKRRGIAVAITASGNFVSGVIWPIVLKEFVASDGWRATFVGVGIFCVLVMVPLALLMRRGIRPGAAGGGAGALAPAQRQVADLTPGTIQLILVVAGVACCVAMSMPQVHIVAYCFDLGYGVARGAEMLSLMLAGGIVSRLLSGFLADVIGGVRTLLLGSVMQCIALLLYMPFDGLASLYAVSLIFGLSQGGIVPSYTIVIREYFPAAEAGRRVGLVIMATVVGMAFGGWLSGWIFDLTGSYQAAFVHGVAWNLLNISAVALLLVRTRSRAVLAHA